MSTPKIIQYIRDLRSSQKTQDTKIDENKTAASQAQQSATAALSKANSVSDAVTILNSSPTVIGSVDYKIKQSENKNLTGKYHTPTATITSSGSATSHSINPLPTAGWSSVGGSILHYTSGAYSIESDVNPTSSGNPLYYAVDGNTSISYIAASGPNAINFIITLPTPLRVTSVKYSVSTAGIPITISGSVDKISWVNLGNATTTNLSTLSEISLSSRGDYRYYEFTFTRPAVHNAFTINELQIGSYETQSYDLNLSLSGISSPLSENQRILIKTPQFSPTGVTKAKFNNVDVDAVLLPNRYYELIYSGNRYLSKEVV